MPADRMFHKRVGHSVKVQALDHLTYRVWTAYQLSADDFGVMRYLPAPLQNDHDRLAQETPRRIHQALDTLVRCGLLGTFEHQGQAYVFQATWQDFQKVEWPAETMMPKIPPAQLETCSEATQRLCSVWPGKQKCPPPPKRGTRESVESPSRGSPEGVASPSGSRARDARMAMATATATASSKQEERRQAQPDDPPIHERRNARIVNQGDPVALFDWQFGKFRDALRPKFGADAYAKTLEWVHRVADDLTQQGAPAPGGNPVEWWDQRYALDWGGPTMGTAKTQGNAGVWERARQRELLRQQQGES